MGKTNTRAMRILEGAQFGDWTVLGLTDKMDYVMCRCVCGTERAVNVYSLYAHKSASCGCAVKRAAQLKEAEQPKETEHGRVDPDYIM